MRRSCPRVKQKEKNEREKKAARRSQNRKRKKQVLARLSESDNWMWGGDDMQTAGSFTPLETHISFEFDAAADSVIVIPTVYEGGRSMELSVAVFASRPSINAIPLGEELQELAGGLVGTADSGGVRLLPLPVPSTARDLVDALTPVADRPPLPEPTPQEIDEDSDDGFPPMSRARAPPPAPPRGSGGGEPGSSGGAAATERCPETAEEDRRRRKEKEEGVGRRR